MNTYYSETILLFVLAKKKKKNYTSVLFSGNDIIFWAICVSL